MATFEVGFCVSGYVLQTVEISDDDITSDDLARKLNAGEVLTTIQEGGSVDLITGAAIGKVVYVNNCCMYSDFAVSIVEDDEEIAFG